jgi:hypothetical protein
MYFCSKCSYSFDIVKSTSVQKDNRIPIDKIQDALKKAEDNEDLTKYVATFGRDEKNKNKKYQKFSDKQKNNFNNLFEEVLNTGAEFKCNNCNNIEPIKKTVLLYNLNLEENQKKIRTLEENEFICKDPILPRTHDYVCKNPNCITHKNPKNKESVFFKENNTFRVNYICCVCFYSW